LHGFKFLIGETAHIFKRKKRKRKPSIPAEVFKKAGFSKKILPLAGGDFFGNP
jgi:hypothetical protein